MARIEFVVGEDGRLIPGTVRVLDVSERRFLEGVLAVAPRWRFTQARIQGCPGKAIVEQPFTFEVQRNTWIAETAGPQPSYGMPTPSWSRQS